MYSFKNDYSEGAHPRILEALSHSNFEQEEGYGEDSHSQQAAERIKSLLEQNDAAVHFFCGGTQTNLTALSAFLRPHEAVIAPCTGHILVHETGAIEATGHKILAVESSDGKIGAAQIEAVLRAHSDEHMVKPRLVYLSQPTEIGSIYRRRELEEIARCCREHRLYLYADGARLGSALCAPDNDLSLPDLAKWTDAFYIGGTKNGALLGEALVILRDELKEDFRFHLKQKGALLAKGRLLGIQFQELFAAGLYWELARHANSMADLLRQGIAAKGYSFLLPTSTNQLFPVFPDALIEELQKNYAFYVWAPAGNKASSVRLVTSWATRVEAVNAFIAELPAVKR